MIYGAHHLNRGPVSSILLYVKYSVARINSIDQLLIFFFPFFKTSSYRLTDDAVSPQPSVRWDFPPHAFGKLNDTELKRVQKYLLSSSSDRSDKPIDDRNGRKYKMSRKNKLF